MFIEISYAEIQLTTQTLIEEVQSVVLETDELESQKETHAYTRFEVLSQSTFHWEQKKIKVSPLKTNEKLKLVDWNLDEGMQPVVQEKTKLNIREHHT